MVDRGLKEAWDVLVAEAAVGVDALPCRYCLSSGG